MSGPLNVRLNIGGRPALTGPTSSVDLSGGWAPAPGGLALPPANPTMAWMYSPCGVHLDDDYLVTADSGNHRVLIWHGVPPTEDEQPADVVLGQPDGTTEGRATGGPARGMNLPTGVLVRDGKLIVADAWHHRILVWNEVPRASDTAPDLVLGQASPTDVDPNRGNGACSASSFYWPFGIAVVGDRFWVADTGNRFRFPYAIGLDGGRLAVSDTANNRVLLWDAMPTDGRAADRVLAQPTFGSNGENRWASVARDTLCWPYGVSRSGNGMAIADSGNNRVVIGRRT